MKQRLTTNDIVLHQLIMKALEAFKIPEKTQKNYQCFSRYKTDAGGTIYLPVVVNVKVRVPDHVFLPIHAGTVIVRAEMVIVKFMGDVYLSSIHKHYPLVDLSISHNGESIIYFVSEVKLCSSKVTTQRKIPYYPTFR